MSKSVPQPDVLVLGEHPAAYLVAALAHQNSKLKVLHATIPEEPQTDRLVVINPAFFSLSPMLEPLRRKLEMTAVYGVQFLSDDPAVRSEYRSKSTLAYVASYKAVRAALAKVAAAEGVDVADAQAPGHPPPRRDRDRRHAQQSPTPAQGPPARRATVARAAASMLGLPDGWGTNVVHRYTYLKLSGGKWADLGSRPTMPMSLNLKDTLCWGWLLPGPKGMQLAIEQPVEMIPKVPTADLLSHWAKVLHANGVLKKPDVPVESAESIDLPLAGALAHEGVANRTLLVGPAGGFYSACTEDIYPNCWSAVFAADAVKKALKERHLQDALQPYRSKWRTTLGEYLRGPQQNFRFLLPLVYRNEVMTTRLTECILLGKSVVR